ncbi:MAG: BREX-1 system adenine-specific DNA-methyltransferase PglX, partial [ANME-2 cluster archaeon]|nr:BREX-1 system adenine-specific DNA-methyltransferase PglX [ANME-2 cluster archaeon]
MQPLEKTLRTRLERTVTNARDIAETAAKVALDQLGVGVAAPFSHLKEPERELRRKLRVHGRQLGDVRDAKSETQELYRLIEEVAYEHWHRMLFARFLAENDLLMYPDPTSPVAVTLQECEDLAADEGAANGWELASRFAARMLPQIFRPDSPVFALSLPPEYEQKLEKLVGELPAEVFKASDSLGWVYQFWQAKKKEEVNASEVKIGARELPAVTQLFTEPYMVSFLLDNSLGAWWAARRLTKNDLATAKNQEELRQKASLPGVPLEYLRFVKGEDGIWTPAAGTFDGWPEHLSKLKTLDPCAGSGHFLVAALLMLVAMRMELERLSAKDAVDAVLRDNIHGLEIDQRCVELAAFALALAAWRYPKAGGYRPLPELNLACSGLSVSVAKEEWEKLGGSNHNLSIALGSLHDEFQNAPVLGSLLNPAKRNVQQIVEWDELAKVIGKALVKERTDEEREVGVAAQGLAKAATLLAGRYNWVITNVPYLARGKQSDTLREYCEKHHSEAKNDLATVFLERCLELCVKGGTSSIVMPQNWLFLTSYRKFREKLLKNDTWHLIARLGEGGFDSSA